METTWHSYPSIYGMGHPALAELLTDAVVVEEKVDGSMFAFGVFEGELKVRSKRQQLVPDAPEKMFAAAVASAHELIPRLVDGWTYYGEYLARPKHNALTYARVPERHVIIFDVSHQPYGFLAYDEKKAEADRLGLETVPCLWSGSVTDLSQAQEFLDRESCLGGTKIEGFVIKNYFRFGPDKKALMGKYVSERFKEIHKTEWRAANPTKDDVVQALIAALKTEARWQKAIQHLREDGQIEDSPRDIGKLMAEVPADISKECTELIKDKLFEWAWPQIRRGIVAGLPEWYKEQLLQKQFAPHAD